MMSRRDLAGAIVGIGMQTRSVHVCEWHESPFYVTVAATYEEPDYYLPSSMVRIETCDCGLMRLPGDLGKRRGKNLAADAAPAKEGE